jgi:pimeloyl-ACP methyl ester carboxylesterase
MPQHSTFSAASVCAIRRRVQSQLSPYYGYSSPEEWMERAYPKRIYYNKLDKGGHFAAWQQPKLFSEEVRAGFRSLR